LGGGGQVRGVSIEEEQIVVLPFLNHIKKEGYECDVILVLPEL